MNKKYLASVFQRYGERHQRAFTIVEHVERNLDHSAFLFACIPLLELLSKYLTMSFFKSLKASMPVPSLHDLESSHYELQNGPYPEFDIEAEKRNVDDPAMALTWMTRMFAKDPKTIKRRQEALLPTIRECDSGRSSTDVDLESQASTDASTLLEAEHEEKPKSGRVDPRVISDAIIGLSDGLTVPFALTAGLSALGNTNVVIFAGLAELTAGAISMGLGGYLGAKSEEESYKQTLIETQSLVDTSSADAATSIKEIFEPYGLPEEMREDLTFHLAKSPNLVQFLMHFQRNSPEQAASRAFICAMTIAFGYFLGGFIPLLPYFLVGKEEVLLALWWSLGVMAVSLFAFGYGKTCFVCGWRGSKNVLAGMKGGLQMVFVGGIAAGCAMGLVRLFQSFTV